MNGILVAQPFLAVRLLGRNVGARFSASPTISVPDFLCSGPSVFPASDCRPKPL
jgi:hypothetical protein